jgi:hypothetical protein
LLFATFVASLNEKSIYPNALRNLLFAPQNISFDTLIFRLFKNTVLTAEIIELQEF